MPPCRTSHASKFQVYYFLKNPVKNFRSDIYFLKLEFTPNKDKHPLQGTELQEKEVWND